MENNIASPGKTRELLRKFNLRGKKSFGQNFLVDQGLIKKIVAAAQLEPEDLVLEIGPGLGALTQALAAAAGRVVALELDRQLIPVLRHTLAAYDNVTIVEGDALKADLDRLVLGDDREGRSYKVVANLPYYITSPLLMRLLSGQFSISSLVVMVQKEVADRMVAPPGGKDYGALSVAVQYRSRPRLVAKVPNTVFIPSPAVDSAVVRLELRSQPPVEVTDEKLFFQVVKGAFGQRRKTLLNALAAAGLGGDKQGLQGLLLQLQVDPNRRGETLSMAEFAAITNALAEIRRGC